MNVCTCVYVFVLSDNVISVLLLKRDFALFFGCTECVNNFHIHSYIVILGMRWRAQQVYGVRIVYFRVPLVIEVWHRDKQLSQDVMIGTGELPLDRIVTTDKFKVSVCICLYIQLSVRCTYLWRIKISCQNYEIILHAR